MPGVSKEQIARAKEIGILEYLMKHEPDSLQRNGINRFILRDHDSFVISKNKWCWNSRGFGCKTATALNYLIKVRGVSFVDAVLALCNNDSLSYPLEPTAPPLPKPFALPPRSRNNDRAVAYLMGRGIDKEIINLCIKAGTLYESITKRRKSKRVFYNCAFVGYDRHGKARFACVRATEGNFRRDMESSDKRYSFCIPATAPPGHDLMVAESAIDTLSLATLKKMETAKWNEYHYIALDGTSPMALIQYLSDHPEIECVTLCLDNDNAGRKGAEMAIATAFECESLKDRTLTFTVKPPSFGDYNDTLQEVIREKREQVRVRRPDRAAILM